MCTCYQNSMNTSARGCQRSTCGGCNGGWWNGTTMVVGGSTGGGCWNGCYNGCYRYISFPVSGTAYVPVSAIRFVPNYLYANTANANTTPCTNGANNANGTVGGNCCGFGRCGGNAAIANFYEDYYARQYGLND